jgi:hypothetical protein
MEQVASRAGFLLGLFFNPEDGSELLSRKVGLFSTIKRPLYPRRYNSS